MINGLSDKIALQMRFRYIFRKKRHSATRALGAALCFAGDRWGAVVRQAKDIIGTGMVEAGKLDQHLGGDIPLAGLVI